MSTECKICKREFKNFTSLRNHIKTHKISSEGFYDKFLKKENEGMCSECGKETKFIDLGKGYHKFCSYKCSSNSKEVKEKKKETCIEKYGVENPSQSEEIKEKIKETCLEKYGTENPSQNEGVKEKIKQTMLEKYGVEHPSQTQEFKESQRERMKNGGAVHALSFNQNPSNPQVELYNLVKSLFPETILNFPAQGKSGDHFFLDIAIPSLMIDVEYDGSYFHPTEGSKFEKDKIRQKDLEETGWKFFRYRDYIPTLEELRENLNGGTVVRVEEI